LSRWKGEKHYRIAFQKKNGIVIKYHTITRSRKLIITDIKSKKSIKINMSKIKLRHPIKSELLYFLNVDSEKNNLISTSHFFMVFKDGCFLAY